MYTGFVYSNFVKYGFANKKINICLTEEGSRRKCGRKMDFEIKPPAAPMDGVPMQPGDVKKNKWVGFVNADCEGTDVKCTGIDYKGSYTIETDGDGEHHLKIEGMIDWEGLPRDITKAFGMFIALST